MMIYYSPKSEYHSKKLLLKGSGKRNKNTFEATKNLIINSFFF